MHDSNVFHHSGATVHKLSKQSSKQIYQALFAVFTISIDTADAKILGVKALLQLVDNEVSRDIRTLVICTTSQKTNSSYVRVILPAPAFTLSAVDAY